MTLHVAVAMGGLSGERDVSLTSGKAVIASLTELGYRVTPVDVDRDFPSVIRNINPDVVFNALHGIYGEDGCLQGTLELLGIPYTHSGVMASAIGMNKPLAKKIFASVGIRCPEGRVVTMEELDSFIAQGKELMPLPYVIKPCGEGSSLGVFIIEKGNNHINLLSVREQWVYGNEMLVEEYIPGRELSAGVIDGKPLGVLELCPKEGFYDFTAKYTDGKTDHLMPAPVPAAIYEEAQEFAVKAHTILGCRGISRCDLRFDDISGKLCLLEINTHPGFTPLSIFPEIAAYNGISFTNLVEMLVKGAACDYQEAAKEKNSFKQCAQT